MERNPIRVVIADDYSIVREGLNALISRQTGVKVVAEARDWPEAVEQILHHRPDIAFTDLRMPGADASVAISEILRRFPTAKIVVFGATDPDEEVYQTLRAGARGYLLKGEFGAEELLRCIRIVLNGQVWIGPSPAAKLAERMKAPPLAKREKTVLQLVVEGKSNKEIGSFLGVSEGTIKVHLNHIFAKLGITGRVAAVGVAVQRGIAHFLGREPPAGPPSKGKSK